ncbi:MAG: hypothetical protein Q4C69_10370 [Lachnoclostridium edouardi]|uniref:hypothetical protein n=1 Tax=Lachnoclostridium edouardi TaxID=1926283 RepID=UPI0026DD1A6C|nr:hypothetical protein [Lachnoclostridium edouardi]MDO4279225.1 hypothetical protein [Lachnoclostridium edouardi]
MRRICAAAFILEAAWFLNTYPVIRFSSEKLYEEKSALENEWTAETIYGITFQLKDGVIQIYRQKQYYENKGN